MKLLTGENNLSDLDSDFHIVNKALSSSKYIQIP